MRFFVVLSLAAASTMVLVMNACGDDATTGAGGSDGGSDQSVTSPTPPSNEGGIVLTPPGPLDADVAARAAVVIASCMSDDGVNRTLQELYLDRTTNFMRSPAVIGCLAQSTKACAALADCLGLGVSTDPQCDGGCTGTVLNDCSESRHIVQDCAKVGFACIPSAGGVCAASGTETCDPKTTQGTCSDGIPTGCGNGVITRGFHCADYGATCERTSQRGSDPLIDIMGCRGSGGSCQSTTSNGPDTMTFEGEGCDGDKLVACLSNGLATLDCASAGTGFHCIEAPDGGPNAHAYCGTAQECTPMSPWEKVKATCDGTSVVACNGGKIQKIDCVSLGFTSCLNGTCRPSGSMQFG